MKASKSAPKYVENARVPFFEKEEKCCARYLSLACFAFHYRTENFVKASQLFFFVEEKRKDCDEMNAWMDDMLSSKVPFTPYFNKINCLRGQVVVQQRWRSKNSGCSSYMHLFFFTNIKTRGSASTIVIEYKWKFVW